MYRPALTSLKLTVRLEAKTLLTVPIMFVYVPLFLNLHYTFPVKRFPLIMKVKAETPVYVIAYIAFESLVSVVD